MYTLRTLDSPSIPHHNLNHDHPPLQELYEVCRGVTDEVGAASNIFFRQLASVDAYIPMIKSKMFPQPFLAADVGDVPPQFLPIGQEEGDDISGLFLNSSRDLPFIQDDLLRGQLFRFGAQPASFNIHKHPASTSS